jgi:hypothetical protein
MAQRGRPRKNREPLERIMARAARIGRPAPEGADNVGSRRFMTVSTPRNGLERYQNHTTFF